MTDLKMSKLDLDSEMETAENFRQKAEEALQSLQENTDSYMRREGMMQGLSIALQVFDAGELARITLCILISISVKEEKYMAVLAHFPYSGFDLGHPHLTLTLGFKENDHAIFSWNLTLTLGPRRFKEMSPYIISPMGSNYNEKNNANQKEAKNSPISDFLSGKKHVLSLLHGEKVGEASLISNQSDSKKKKFTY